MASPCGVSKSAAVPVASRIPGIVPLKEPPPASVVTVPLVVTRRITLFRESATYTLKPDLARAVGPLNRAFVPTPSLQQTVEPPQVLDEKDESPAKVCVTKDEPFISLIMLLSKSAT